jgi:hypothetical protein
MDVPATGAVYIYYILYLAPGTNPIYRFYAGPTRGVEIAISCY